MPVYRTIRDFVGGSTLFDLLKSYLTTLVSKANIDLLQLSPHETDEDRRFAMREQGYDALLVREGRPLLAVTIVCRTPRVEVDPFAGIYAEKEPTIADMAVGLADRLVKELTPTKAQEAAASKPKFVEASWSIAMRYPGIDLTSWTGSPFDVDAMEKAFIAITDAIVARSKA